MAVKVRKLHDVTIPDPTKWDWDALSAEQVEARAEGLRTARASLQELADGLWQEMEAKRVELFDHMANDPKVFFQDQMAAKRAIDELVKDRERLIRDRSKCDRRLEYVESRLP